MPVGMKPVSVKVFGSIGVHPAAHHLGDVEGLAVGRAADVLGHPALAELEVADDRAVDEVDLHEAALELAGDDDVAAVDGEVGVVHARAVGTSSELSTAIVCGSRKSSRLRASATMIADLPSGVKYMLYGSSTLIGSPGLPVCGSIGVSEPSDVPSALFVTHSVLQVVGRHDVLRVEPDREGVDHLVGRRVDDRDRVRRAVGHVDARQRALRGRAEHVRLRRRCRCCSGSSPAACPGSCRSCVAGAVSAGLRRGPPAGSGGGGLRLVGAAAATACRREEPTAITATARRRVRGRERDTGTSRQVDGVGAPVRARRHPAVDRDPRQTTRSTSAPPGHPSPERPVGAE